jgi:hypothetical protein
MDAQLLRVQRFRDYSSKFSDVYDAYMREVNAKVKNDFKNDRNTYLTARRRSYELNMENYRANRGISSTDQTPTNVVIDEEAEAAVFRTLVDPGEQRLVWYGTGV